MSEKQQQEEEVEEEEESEIKDYCLGEAPGIKEQVWQLCTHKRDDERHATHRSVLMTNPQTHNGRRRATLTQTLKKETVVIQGAQTTGGIQGKN